MNDDASGQDPGGEDPRISDLQRRLKAAEQVEAIRTGKAQVGEADASYRLGNRVLAELIGGIAGGALVGWVLDRLIGTSPWLLLAFLFLGIVVAFRNIIRISGQRPEQ